MTDPHPHTPPEPKPPEPTPSKPNVSDDDLVPSLFQPTAEYACAGCSFRLKGLPDEGACPECGQPYTRATAVRLLQPPQVSDALIYLATPLAIPCSLFVIGAAPLLAADDAVGACLFVLGLLALPPCMIWLGRRVFNLQRGLRACLPPERDPSRDWRTTASTLGCVGQALIGAGWTFTVLTVVVGGACLAFSLAVLSR